MSTWLPAQTNTSSTLIDLLRQRAEHQANQRAYTFLLDGETTEAHLTYGELDRRARAVGALLQHAGAAGERALLLYPPGLDYIIAFFGCLYAGVVAVPAYPPNPARLERTLPRLRSVVQSARPAIALTTSSILPIATSLGALEPDFRAMRWLATDDDDAELAQSWQNPAVNGDTLAFLQYTSGSTAAPKGVMLTQANLLHNSALIERFFAHTPASRGVIWLPPYHDMGLIGGILQPLYADFPVTLMSPVDFLQRPLRWLQAISRYQATTSGGPNFAYDLCVRKISPEQRATLDLSTWQVAFNGAEPIRHDTLERFVAAFAPCGFRREAFYPCYGLAEATLIVSGGQLGAPPLVRAFAGAALEHNQVLAAAGDGQSDARVLVGSGQSAPDQQIVVVDPETSSSCRPGQVGEIWVAGPSVAQGYWQQPAETRRTFLARLADSDAGPFLRTGDLGFLQDGELFVTGRVKDLIIIRGRNHYPQDIELTVEQSHPSLRPGCGAAFVIEVDGDGRLVVVQEVERQARHDDSDMLAGIIRQAVADRHDLHVHAVVLLKPGSIPKTSSGKIQRHVCRAEFLAGSLSAIGSSILEIAEAAPDTAELSRDMLLASAPEHRQALLEGYLQAMVARVLRIAPSHLDPRQPVSSLGLDSLMAVELQHSVESGLGIVMPMVQFLQDFSIATLAAEALAQLSAPLATPAARIAPARAAGPAHPLSYGQRALWFLHQLAPESAAYNIASAVKIRADLDVPALQRAFQRLVDRHPALRSTFTAAHGKPAQLIHDHVVAPFTLEDASGWSEARLNQHLVVESERPFDLEHGPLLHIWLFKRATHESILLLSIHHSVADLWSLGVLMRELGALYAAEQTGGAAPLAPLELWYTDYVYWQAELLAGPEGERLWNYWRQQLAGALPALDLPTDRPRRPVQTYRGAAQNFSLDARLTRQLKALAQTSGATLYTTLLASFQALLHRYTGQDTILVGSPTTGRGRAELSGLVGYFVNPIVLRADLAGNPTFAAFLQQMRQTALAAFEHQAYPFQLLVERLQPDRDPSRSPLFQVMFALQQTYAPGDEDLAGFAVGETSARVRLGELVLEPIALEQQIAQFDLSLMIAEVQGTLAASLQYNADLFDAATIARMAGHFQTLLQGIAAHPEAPIATLPLLSAAERRQILVDRNATQADYPQDATIQTLFEAQVARTPDAVALVFDRPTTNDQRPTTGDETRGQGDKETRRDGGWPRLSPQSSVLSPEQVTYQALNLRANQLAHHLRALGVGPEVLVGVYMERSVEMVVALLAVLKAGGAYVPLDPAYPNERLAFVLDDTQAPVLLTNKGLGIGDWGPGDKETRRQGDKGTGRQAAPSQAPRPTPIVVYLDADWPAIAQERAANPANTTTAENMAYVIYTSGSTGRPKGVQIAHRSVTNLIYWHQRTFGVSPADRTTQLAGPAFDASVWELWPYLTAGASIHFPDEETRATPAKLRDWLVSKGITICFLPTPLAESILALDWPTPTALRTILTGGDKLQRFPAPGLPFTLVNNYGPTESTVVATSGLTPATVQPSAAPDIGQPIANTQTYILDAQLQPTPVGLPGELYIGGAGLARGYLNRPDLTAQRFVPNPFAKDEGRRMKDESPDFILHPSSFILYRTGDLARYRSDGTLEFLGRNDHQVKIRGFRIELGEIEMALRQHPALLDAVVVAREDTPGDKRLVAYVVPATDKERGRQGDKERGKHRDKETRRQGDKVTGDAGDPQSLALSPQDSAPPSSFILHPSSLGVELRGFLKQRLPDYMTPAAFVALPALPLTPNGKLDRQALPAPDRARLRPEEAFVGPRTPIEEAVAEIWRAVLQIEQIDVYDNFFELGGHSLLATQVIARMREIFQVELPLSQLFKQPTVAGLAEGVVQSRQERPMDLLQATNAIDQGAAEQLLADLDRLSETDIDALLQNMLTGEGVAI